MELIDATYALVHALPDSERFGLAVQLRRAAVSVAANIAEGQGRRSKADFTRFLSFARGSLMEVETLLLVASRQGYFSQDAVESAVQITSDVSRMLAGLSRHLQRSIRRSTR
jgi:four helix bundle protein